MRNASGHESQNVRQSKKVSGNTQHFLHKTCSRGKQRQRDVQKGAGRAKLLFFFLPLSLSLPILTRFYILFE